MASNGSARKRYIVVTLRAFRDGRDYVSECVELQTASQGDSLEEAIDMARDAAEVYVEGLAEVGELDRVLRERRIKVLTAKPRSVPLRTDVQPGDLVQVVVLPITVSRASAAA